MGFLFFRMLSMGLRLAAPGVPLQILKNVLEKSRQFLSSDEPSEPKSLDVALNIAEIENYAWKPCDCSQPRGHSIRVLNGKER